MADLIPWLFLLPPTLVTLAALGALAFRAAPAGRARALMIEGGQHLYRRELEPAEARFRDALKLQPDHPPLLGTLGSLLVSQERFEEALPLLERAAAAQPRDMPIQLVLGRCLQGLGQEDKAAQRWSLVPPEDPVYPDAQAMLAGQAEARGDLDAAITAVQAAIRAASVHEARPLKVELKRLEALQRGEDPASPERPARRKNTAA